MPGTKNKVGRVFLMVILSEFQQISSNKNSQFSQKTQIAIRNFRNFRNVRNIANKKWISRPLYKPASGPYSIHFRSGLEYNKYFRSI